MKSTKSANLHDSRGPEAGNPWGKVAMIRSAILAIVLVALIDVAALPVFCQSNPDLETFFQQNIGLTPDQIAAIRSGQPVAKTMPSRTPAEVFLFGAVYVHAAPESYLRFAHDFDRLRKLLTTWLSRFSAILRSFLT
jgi:hypothetical protein